MYPDYYQLIERPMDLSIVQEKLDGLAYQSPLTFAEDVRQIFCNSKMYNTNKRSRIYAMTFRLSSLFDDVMKPILRSHQSLEALKKRRETNSLSPARSSTKRQPSRGSGGGTSRSSGKSSIRLLIKKTTSSSSTISNVSTRKNSSRPVRASGN